MQAYLRDIVGLIPELNNSHKNNTNNVLFNKTPQMLTFNTCALFSLLLPFIHVYLLNVYKYYIININLWTQYRVLSKLQI